MRSSNVEIPWNGNACFWRPGQYHKRRLYRAVAEQLIAQAELRRAETDRKSAADQRRSLS